MLTGAHALSALPDTERVEFEAHLRGCRGCTDEVTGLRETTARLGNALDHFCPMALRAQVLDAVRLVRQVRPASEVVPVFSRRQGLRRAAALILAACVVAAAVAGAHGAATTTTITTVAGPAHSQVGDLLAAPDLRLVTAGSPAGTAAMSPSRDDMLLLVDGLHTLAPDRVYQLWLVDGDGPRSAGILCPVGASASLLVTGIEGVLHTILTVEPAGGSPVPTGSPVLAIALH
ncbi:hypothetical protein ADL03_20970 [Nocardia sp. NRRL S-836]|nr:hypothetical protein ADL03_20970 [Nocardia sp. NRRL S-836]